MLPETHTSPPSEAGARPATIYDVAKAAGVSHQTVSRLLKGEQNIKPNLRTRVEQALKDLDYTPNEAARALATRRSRKIGAVITDLEDWAPQQILRGVAAAARQAGYVLEIVPVDITSRTRAVDSVSLLSRVSHAGAVVLASSDQTVAALDEIGLDLPVVVEIEPELVPGDPRVVEHPSRLVVDHLAELGHERFFEITGPANWRAARARSVAYRERVDTLGLTHLGSVEGDWSAASGYAAMAAFDRGATAVVAANDLMALGAMYWLGERSIGVPHEVSVVGYDGVPEGQFYSPPLTTVTADFVAMGGRAVQQLLNLIEPGSVLVEDSPISLTVRSSTGPARP